ncbi:MAG: glycosyl hydrolase family 28-related protein [Planctomycetota bacterium]
MTPLALDPFTIDVLSTHSQSVRDSGAVGDGETDDGPAIQRALDEHPGRVVIPPGSYRIGRTLLCPSGTRLIAHPEAVIAFADGSGQDESSFLITNAPGAEDITITGGVWDGNNPGNPRGPDRPGAYSGCVLGFHQMRGLTLRSLTVRDPESFFIRLGEVTSFRIEDIQLEARHLRPNQDGVHLGGGCEDGEIRRIHGVGLKTPNDDMVALNADDALERAPLRGLVNAPIRRIRIEDLRADDCHSFVRLLSVWSPIEDITIRGIRGGCRISAFNLDAARDAAVPLFDPEDPKVAEGVGWVRRLRVEDVELYKSADAGEAPLLDVRTRCDDVRFERFTRNAVRDTRPDTPTLRLACCPSTHLTLDGLEALQAEALYTASPGVELQRLVLPQPATPRRYRAAVRIDHREQFDLPSGGFDSLALDHEHAESPRG